MPIERRNLYTAGVLMGAGGRPVGTFFNLMVRSNESGYAHPYMVTAAHVVMDQSEIEARIRAVDGSVLRWPASRWSFPDDDPRLDIAVRPLDSPSVGPNAIAAIPIDQALERSAPGKAPKLGTPVYFFGLLAATGAERMGLEAVPVVRSGNVAQLDQPNVSWDGMTANRVHLIDVRSRGGFSGSPCFVQFTFPGPPADPLPTHWATEIRGGGGDPDTLGVFHTLTTWWGMFVAHVDESGIGVVLPAQFILDFLESETFLEMQERQDEAARTTMESSGSVEIDGDTREAGGTDQPCVPDGH